MKLLVICEDYPSGNNLYALAYIHTRVIQYLKEGIDVEVLSFNAKKDYSIDNVKVITKNSFKGEKKDYDICVSHAPNLKHHLPFLVKYRKKYIHLVIFFHGHETLLTRKYYPEPYGYDRKGKFRRVLQIVYDPFKLLVLKKFINKRIAGKGVSLVYVSEWMRDAAYSSLKLNRREIDLFASKSFVINNSINPSFIASRYKRSKEQIADIITIRPFDNPKYGVDIVCKIAENNPDLTFAVYGKGDFFKWYPKPDNLIIFNQFVSQDQIPSLLNKFRAALMPTRLDAQGVMMCEMAVYGIPLIASDIGICREMLDVFPYVGFVENEEPGGSIRGLLLELESNASERKIKFDYSDTVKKEVELFERICNA